MVFSWQIFLGRPANDVPTVSGAKGILTTKVSKFARRPRSDGALCASLVFFVLNNVDLLADPGMSA
jgi:hypothetical protein